MKKFKILSALIVLFTAIGFTSCESEPVDPLLLNTENNNNGGNPPGGNPASGTFRMNIDGAEFTASNTVAMISGNSINVNGIKVSTGETMSILVLGTTTGTYTENSLLMYKPSFTSQYAFSNIDFEQDDEDDATVTITNINTTNKTISGTFKFTGYWQNSSAAIPNKNFTNGVFTDIPYTTPENPNPNPNPDPEPTDDQYIRAKVNGTLVDFSNDITVVGSTIDGLRYTNIIGSTTDMKTMTLNLNGSTAPGTYQITSGFSGQVNASYRNDGTTYTAEAGTLTITSNSNGILKGMFQFAGINEESGEQQISEGVFNVEY